ncbi:MAG: nucleotide exchange factor GrpE [Smithella sp.]
MKNKKEHMDNGKDKTEEAQDHAKKDDAAEYNSESKDIKERLAEKEAEAATNYDKYVRAVAELDNYKKRAAKEKSDVLKYGKEEIVKDLLPFIDSLDRALEQAESCSDVNSFKEGFKLIQDQLFTCLKRHGVEVIECTGKDFDPNFHEAMMQVESKEHEANKVVCEFQRGYLINGRLLRPSKVSVCKKNNKENDDKNVENEE